MKTIIKIMGITAGAVVLGAIAWMIVNQEVIAFDVNEMKQEMPTIVTPKVNCTQAKSMKSEYCIRGVLDNLADKFLTLEEKDKELENAVNEQTKALEEYNTAVALVGNVMD